MTDPGGLGGPFRTSGNRPRGNLNVLRISVLGLFGLLAVRLAYMQIVDGPSYAQRATQNHLSQQTVPAARGLIYDRNGTPLVENVPVYSAQIEPDLLPASATARYAIYQQLEKILGVPALEIQTEVKQAEANNQASSALTIKDHLNQNEALMLDEASTSMPGVTLVTIPGRYYPAGNAFSDILGYMGPQPAASAATYAKQGYPPNEWVGITGLEEEYQQALRGKPGETISEQDASGQLIQQLKTVAPTPGDSLKLSIDAGLQNYVTQVLKDYMNYGNNAFTGFVKARTAAAVVMNPQTGEIYALASIPSYNNNIFSNLQANESQYQALANNTAQTPLLDHALQAAAPGSTFKLVTASAGLQNGTVKPYTSRTINSTVLHIKGVNGQIYNLYDWEVHGTIDLYQGIAQSSDIYFYGVSCGLPATDGLPPMQGLASNSDQAALILGQYARAFGLGSPTGIDLPGEAAGNVPSPAQKLKEEGQPWVYFDTCYMGIGQGNVLASPLQMARVTAAVANGGQLVTPHVVDQIVGPDGKVVQNITPTSKQVPVSVQNLDVVKEGMHLCVQQNTGACTEARAPGIDMSGKTGTAEFNDPLEGGALEQHAWFTGFAPYNNPQVVITVYFDLGWGGARAAPAASKIASYFFQHVAGKVNG